MISKAYTVQSLFIVELREYKKGDLLKKLKERADIAAKTSAELSKKTIEKGSGIGKQLKEQSLKSMEEGIATARKAAASGEKNLEILKKLAELKEAGIISEKEFAAKKKEILERI